MEGSRKGGRKEKEGKGEDRKGKVRERRGGGGGGKKRERRGT